MGSETDQTDFYSVRALSADRHEKNHWQEKKKSQIFSHLNNVFLFRNQFGYLKSVGIFLSSNLPIFNRHLPVTTIIIPFSGLRSKITKYRILFSYQNLFLIRHTDPGLTPPSAPFSREPKQGKASHSAQHCPHLAVSTAHPKTLGSPPLLKANRGNSISLDEEIV